MKIMIEGFVEPIALSENYVRTLEILEPSVMAQVCLGLSGDEADLGQAQLALWDGDVRQNCASTVLVCWSPYVLPWEERSFVSALFKRLEQDFIHDEDLRAEIERSLEYIKGSVRALTLDYEASYEFDDACDVKKLCKSLGLGPLHQREEGILAECLAFFNFLTDIQDNRLVVLLNFKSFLTKDELKLLLKQTLSQKRKLLLLESSRATEYIENEKVSLIDQDFLQF